MRHRCAFSGRCKQHKSHGIWSFPFKWFWIHVRYRLYLFKNRSTIWTSVEVTVRRWRCYRTDRDKNEYGGQIGRRYLQHHDDIATMPSNTKRTFLWSHLWGPWLSTSRLPHAISLSVSTWRSVQDNNQFTSLIWATLLDNLSRHTHTQVVFDKNLELSTQGCRVNAVCFPLLRAWCVLPKWKRTNHILCWVEIRRTCGGLWTTLLFGCPALQWKTRLLSVMPWSEAERELHACCL